MPPHCDSEDGPVVLAARKALETGDPGAVLPFVKKDGEAELLAAFNLALRARTQGADAREVADRFLFETAVRLHRAGEGAPFTGIKPAGLDVGPVIPLAEEAIASGSVENLSEFLTAAVRREIDERYGAMLRAKERSGTGVDAAREYVEAMLGLEVWAHKLYGAVKAEAHGEHHGG